MDVLIMKCKICGIMVFAGKEPKAYMAMNPNHADDVRCESQGVT
jgi:hypothetical protein